MRMIRNINILLAGILVLSMCASCSKSQDANSAWQERRIERQVERTLKRMTTREKVAQLIVSQTDIPEEHQTVPLLPVFR